VTREERARLAKALEKNRLLPILIQEKADDIREQWEATKPEDVDKRERLYLELRTLTELKEYIYAEVAKPAGGDAG
jgi:hypothetical protein